MPSSGRGVIEEIGRGLGVGEQGMEAARMAFRRFGNQSSSSMWYQLSGHAGHLSASLGDDKSERDRPVYIGYRRRTLRCRSSSECRQIAAMRKKTRVADEGCRQTFLERERERKVGPFFTASSHLDAPIRPLRRKAIGGKSGAGLKKTIENKGIQWCSIWIPLLHSLLLFRRAEGHPPPFHGFNHPPRGFLFLAGKMRRVVRAGSPEVLWISDASPSFRELDDVFVQTQTRIWLGEVLHIRFDEETTIADLLADGELLFQVSKVVWKMLLKKHVELKHSNIYIYERTSFGKNDGRYMPYPKVDSFLKICQILGLTGIDLFSPSDIVEKRDVRRVCMCIRSLSKKARSKNLDVPDFDIVTYTIAMPTDLVGGIRRYLEQSQCSSSSSNGCSPCTDAREMYRQKSFGGVYARHYDSYSESDEAESTFTECDFQSPLSNVSNDAANLSHIVGEISLGGSSIFDEKSSKLQTEFQLISLDQNEDGNKSLVASYAKTINNGNDQFKVAVHRNSSSAECQSDQGVRACFAGMGEMMCPISKLKSGFLINNIDTGCLETRASSFEDSPLVLDEPHSANAKETFEGYTGTMIWSKGLENSVSNRRDFDSYKIFDYVEEEFMQSIVDPSGQALEINQTAGDSDNVRDEFTTLLEETSNKCYAYTTDAHDEKPSCNIIIGSSDIAHDNVALEACIMNGEGKKDNSNSSIIKMDANSLVKNRSIPGNCTDLRPGTSDLCLDNIDGGNFIQSVQSVCKGYRNGVDKKSLDEVDAEVDSTPSLNAISDKVSEDKTDSSDCTANSFLLSEAFEQCNFELQTSASELVGSLAEEAMNSNLYDMEANAHKMKILSFEIDCTGGSSASETESPAIYDLSLLDCFTCDTEELNSYMETVDLDSVGTFSSIAGKKQSSMGISNDLQLDRDCNDFSHLDSSLVDNNLALPTHSDSSNDPGMIENKNHSFTCTVISDDCDLYKGKCALPLNDCPHIIGSFKEARSLIPNSVVQDTNVPTPDLEVDADKLLNDSIMTTEYGDVSNPGITANSISVSESKTYDSTIGCLKHVPSTSFDMDGVEIQLVARECKSETDGETKMKVVKQNDTCYYPCDTNNNMQAEFRENLCEKLYVKNGLGENTSDYLEYGNNICFPLNEKDDDGCLISICVPESDDSQLKPTTGCGGCNVRTLSEENGTIADLHAIVSSNILSNSDAGCSLNNRMQQIIVNASDNTTLPMGNAITERKASAILRFDYLSEIHELPTEGMKNPVELNGIYTQGSNILDGTKSTVIDNVILEAPNQHHVSDPVSCCDPLHNNCSLRISSGRHFEESRQTQVIQSCLASASTVDTETCTQESIRVEAQVLPLVDALTTIKPKEEKGMDIEEFKTEPVTMLGSSGKNQEGATGELHRPSRKVLTSVAGGVTLLGALFFLLHRRGRRGNQKTNKTVVPLQTQKSGQVGFAPKQTETNSTAGLYPADRLKF